MCSDGNYGLGGSHRRAPERRNDNAHAEVEQINGSKHAKNGESGGGGCQQRAETERDADKEQKIAKLNTGYSS